MIIDRFNERFGTDWTDADRLVFDAAATDLVNDQQMQMTAANNTAENFSLIFGERFQRALLERIDRNEKVVFKFQTTLSCRPRSCKIYSTLVQTRAKVAYQEHCPISELLGPDRESQYLEYKSTPHPRRQRRGLQATGDNDHQDGRRVPEQPRRWNAAHRVGDDGAPFGLESDCLAS